MNTMIIDLSPKKIYNPYLHMNSKNIPYDDLISNYKKYLNKNTIYYLYCEKGMLSRRAQAILSYFGYSVFVLDK